MVGVVTEHEETATACNDARLFLGYPLQNFRFYLKHVLGSQHIRLLAKLCKTGAAIDESCADIGNALEVLPPSGLAAFQFLNLLDCEVVLFLQSHNQSLIVKVNSKFAS